MPIRNTKTARLMTEDKAVVNDAGLIALSELKKLKDESKRITAKDAYRGFFNIMHDEQLKSPKGGVSIEGTFYPGGQFIPAGVDQEAARKAIAEKEKKNKSDKEKAAEKTAAEKTVTEKATEKTAAEKVTVGKAATEKAAETNINFVKMDEINEARQKAIDTHKLNEEHIKDVISFEGYDIEAFYSFPKRMPGITYVVVTATGKEETATKGKHRDVIETTFSVDEDKPDEVHLDFMEVYSSKNKGIAKDYIKRIEDYIRKTGKKKITLLADISIGRYAWAKMGFKADTETVKRLKRKLIEHASGVLKIKYGGTPEYGEERAKLLKKIDKINSVEEIADFDFPNTEYTAQELKDNKQMKYYNPDVPSDMKMKVGKSFLTNNSMSLDTDWHGTRKVGDTKDCFEIAELGVMDEETAEPRRMLLFTNKERGVREGETDYEFHKDILMRE